MTLFIEAEEVVCQADYLLEEVCLQLRNHFSFLQFLFCFVFFCFFVFPSFTNCHKCIVSCVAQKHKKSGFRTEMTKSNIFNSSCGSGLLNWVRKLRAKDGPLSPKQYTGIVRKARTKQELLDVVHDFEEKIGKVNGIFLAAAAHTAANIDSCPPSVAANLLSQIPKNERVFEGVSISVLNKAANAQDITSARVAFDVLQKTEIEDAWSGLLRACSNHSVGFELVEQMIVEIECKSRFDVRLLGTMLKCAGNMNQFDVVERVWKWSQPMRKYRLDGDGGTDCGVALQYTQFVILCSKHGHVDKVLETWNEWCQSVVGRRDNTLHSEVFRDVVMAALSAHPTTISEARKMLEKQLTIECDFEGDVQTLGGMLKCAGNMNQFDVVERVWKWSRPIRKHRLDGGGGKDCDVALIYTQLVTLCSRHDHVDKVLEVWNEWKQSTIGRRDNTLHSEIFRGAVMTALSIHPTTVSEACKMLEKQLTIECEFDGDGQALGSMLKCAGNVNQFDVVERVWKWSQPIRKHRLDGGGGKDCDVALSYTQFVALCSKHGHVEKVLEVWNEWKQSTIGRRDTLHSEVFRGAVMTALSIHPTTVSEACKMLEKQLMI